MHTLTQVQAPPDPLVELGRLLASARDDWHPAGRPDASGAMVGGSVALRIEELGEPGSDRFD
jgi:hypothetical protein